MTRGNRSRWHGGDKGDGAGRVYDTEKATRHDTQRHGGGRGEAEETGQAQGLELM